MKTVRIVAISDTHGFHRLLQLPKGDILVHAGDCLVSGRDPKELIDFNHWLEVEAQGFAARIVIAGNHDFLFQEQCFARGLLTNATYLEHTGVKVLGLNFWGQPIVPQFQDWAFMAPRGLAMDRYWNQVPLDTDVLVTHGPPLGTRDEYEGQHVGCERQELLLNRHRFPLVLCGHIHSGRGTTILRSGTVVANVATMDQFNQPPRPPVVFDVESSG